MMNFDKRIVHAATTVELIERNTRIVSTNGADIDQKMDIVLVNYPQQLKIKMIHKLVAIME